MSILGGVKAFHKRAAAGVVLLVACGACSRRTERAASVPAVAKDAGGWEEIRIGTDAVFNGLHFVDADTGWIVGGSPFVSGGIAGRTEDGGMTWRYVTGVTGGGPTSVLSAVRGFDRMRACAVGDGVFLTFDGGRSWQRARAARGAVHLATLDFLDEREGWTAGATGVFRTRDGGMTWVKLGSDPGAPIWVIAPHALRFLDSQTGFVAGMHGNLWRTRDGGETWARASIAFPSKGSGPAPTLWGLAFEGAVRGWVVGDAGTVLRTTDGGASWEIVDAGAGRATLTAIAFAGSDGWIAGFLPDGAARSVIYRTRDGGATWALERTLEGEEMRVLQVLDANTAWAVGDRVRTEPQRMLRRAALSGR